MGPSVKSGYAVGGWGSRVLKKHGILTEKIKTMTKAQEVPRRC